MQKASIVKILMVFLLCYNLGCKKGDNESVIIKEVDYYVAPDGDDNNPGTILEPWRTWQKAFSTADAGDTVYFRGGVYPSSDENCGGEWFDSRYSGHNGTRDNPICFYNYPGEKPILDGSAKLPSGLINNGILIKFANYMNIKGLKIRNIQMTGPGVIATGMYLLNSNNVIIENMEIYNIGGVAYQITDNDTVYIINSDAHHCCDSLGVIYGDQPYAGGNGDGFQITHSQSIPEDQNDVVYFRGCRAWHVSDDGWGQVFEGYIEYDSCWSINNGHLNGDGNGFKIARAMLPSLPLARTMRNCLAVYNRFSGINENNRGTQSLNMHIYNNVTYKNKWGFLTFTTGANGEPIHGNWYRNNISYQDSSVGWFHGDYEHEYNSWDLSVTITDDDFISVDTAGLTGPRQRDGSLPYLRFLNLTQNSDLIDAGIDVGLPYLGKAPDLGAYERE
jgi:hypothetical protein